LKYRLLPDEAARERKVYLLEILDVDRSRELSRFVAFRLVRDDEMIGSALSTFDSYEAFLADRPTGRQPGWFRDKCSTVRRFMR